MRRRAQALILALSMSPHPAVAAGLELVGRIAWEGDVVQGVSGIEVSEDGTRFVAVGDAGWWYRGRLERRGGLLEAVGMESVEPILGIDGLPVPARRVGDWSDAEGLAIAPDGTAWVSFERWSRVQRFDPGSRTGTWIRDHPAFRAQWDNRQLEALAVDASGTVYALPERPLSEGFPIFVLRPDGWVIEGHVPERKGFSVVGADFAEDGTLWLLERKLVLGLWWQNRIRRLDPAAPEAAEIVWTGGLGAFYNLEGISVWQASDGLRLLCVEDNNGRDGASTGIVEFLLVDGAGDG